MYASNFPSLIAGNKTLVSQTIGGTGADFTRDRINNIAKTTRTGCILAFLKTELSTISVMLSQPDLDRYGK
jgi:hypothetical protein